MLTSLWLAKTSEKNLCCLLKIDITSVIVPTKTNIPADDIQLFFVFVMKFMMIYATIIPISTPISLCIANSCE